MDILKILIPIICIYVFVLIIWWIICKTSSSNAIDSKKRAHFDVVEMIDIAIMRFWRFVSYCVLAGLIVWLVLVGYWYFAILPLLWFAKVWWFGSLFYLPFNIVESHYMAKVELCFGHKHAIKAYSDRNKQVEAMKERGWTVPDKMK